MPVCNRPDRGSSFALPRKGADFRLVLDHEKGAERLNRRGYFRRCVPLAPLKARWALCVSSVQPRIVKAAGVGRRVLHGALSRLEPGAGKLARRVLRGGVGRKARPLPDSTATTFARCSPGRTADSRSTPRSPRSQQAAARDRAGLERASALLCLPPFPLERLDRGDDQHVIYRLPTAQRDGNTLLSRTPQELIDQLAAQIVH